MDMADFDSAGNSGQGCRALHQALGRERETPSVILVCLVSLFLSVSVDCLAELAAKPGDRRSGFVDVTAALGLDYHVKTVPEGEEPKTDNQKEEPADPMYPEDGGLTLIDIDGDGSLELYVAHGSGEKGLLFSYDGSRFTRLADNRGIQLAGIDRAGYFIDLDHDGLLDFVSIQSQGVQLFRNNSAGWFVEDKRQSGIRNDRSTHSMAAADIDNDGDLDLFFAHWFNLWNEFRPPSQYLWRNDGRGRYEDISHVVQIRPVIRPHTNTRLEFSITPTFADIDADGDPDILLSSDFGSSQVLRNEAGTAFVDTGGEVITDENGMGAAVGDYDRDGDLDWFVTSIHDADGSSDFGPTGNRLYRNIDGSGQFSDATEDAGVREGGWGWGTCFADFDNDGYLDLFQTNGWFVEYVEDAEGELVETSQFVEDPSRLFMSDGDGTFSERASELGIHHSGQGRGVVCHDYDGDGRVDIFIANNGAAPTVYSNVFENANHWLQIDLAGRHANTDGIGALVTIRTASGNQMQEMRLGSSYLSQAPSVLHFGLGKDRMASLIEVRWPGPGNQISRLENVIADQRLTIRQPVPDGFPLSVVRGAGGGLHSEGMTVSLRAAEPRKNHSFSHWTSEGGGVFGDLLSPETTFTMPANPVTVFAHYLPGPPPSTPTVSVARRWIELMLQAIRDDFARPPIHARNLFHLSAAMYDAWAIYSESATPYLLGDAEAPCMSLIPPKTDNVRSQRQEAVSHAAWRIIRHRFRHSPSARHNRMNADALMSALGYDTDVASAGAAIKPAARLGKCIGEFYISRGLTDGSNEANNYGIKNYRPVNPPLEVYDPGNYELIHPDRWQPLSLEQFVDQSGFMITTDTADFVTPEWGRVIPFALTKDDLTVHERGGSEYYVYHDPGPPPTLRGPLAELYKWGFSLVAIWSSELSPEDGVLIDIAPSSMGNVRDLPRTFEEHIDFYSFGVEGSGHDINPATGKSYEPQLVPKGDYVRVLAEFWADGPDSETPPGHWFTILNTVNDHELHVRQLGGKGPELEPLELDIKAYFTLGGAMHDASIAAWGIKGWYDYVRPISALRAMAGRGQSSDPVLPSWSTDGIPLVEGFIELVSPDDPLAGEYGEHVDKIKLLAWRGPDSVDDPATDVAGVGWILADNWWPYQRPSFVTPPFAGYVSGHSTYSRAAAEVLTALTGNPFFPGGMSEFEASANSFLVFERGPSVDMTLQWATYRDAADQCSLSRIWGGIHPPADDIPGRLIGARVGLDAFRSATSHFQPLPPRR